MDGKWIVHVAEGLAEKGDKDALRLLVRQASLPLLWAVRAFLLALLPLLAACGNLPGAGAEGEFQLLNAEELKMTIKDRSGRPFNGTFRVLTREAPVVEGRVYLSLRGLVPSPDPYLDTDPWCTGTQVLVEWWYGTNGERGGLFYPDGGETRLYLVPRALPYPYPAREYWALVYTGEGVAKKGLQACAGRQVQYDLELSPGWNLVYAEPPTPEHAAWVYGRQEAYWKVSWY
ncbi:hypothetical protein [Thermus sp.]|uniref:hypothetical protein n=1 Tax=Thermus sp. TaxID=275 RepID=UPI003D0FD749